MARKSRKNTVNTQPEILNTAVYIRTAQYIRLSVEDSHNQGNSIENQKMILDDFITRNGNMRLAGVYIDNEATGTNFQRPEFQRMIEDIEKCLNTKLKQEIYCPIDDKIEIEIIKICNNLKKSDFYKFGQKILCNLLLKYGFKLNLLVNLKKADVNDIDGIITIRNKDSVINLSVDKSMVSDIRQYNMVHRYPNREYFFLNTKGKKITSSSALATIQEKLEEVNNINTTTLALKGVSKLIQKGLTLSEIKYLTGFETKKIEDVSRWLMNQEDVESVINNKLNLIDI